MRQRIKVLVRRKLKLSSEKMSAQTAHAVLQLKEIAPEVHPMMSVVVLTVNETPFNNAKTAHDKVALIRDAGYTEVAPGTETVLAFLEDDPRIY